jgi:hypothetical protein
MTAEQRAEKIRDLFRDETPVPDYLLPAIATQIREAVVAALQESEAFKAGREQGAFECRHAKDIAVRQAVEEARGEYRVVPMAHLEAYEEGRKAGEAIGLENADKILEKYQDETMCDIQPARDRIRARAKEALRSSTSEESK